MEVLKHSRRFFDPLVLPPAESGRPVTAFTNRAQKRWNYVAPDDES